MVERGSQLELESERGADPCNDVQNALSTCGDVLSSSNAQKTGTINCGIREFA